MTLSLRAFVAATLAICSLLLLRPAQAQAPYPNQTIRFIVTHAAGGLPDTVARIVARRLQARIGQNVVVENRTGASGGVATNALAQAPADGYTFLVSDGSIISIIPQLYSKIAYNPKILTPVAMVARAPLFLAAHPKLPVTTLKEFIDYVKAHPGQINYGSSGVGSTHHLTMEGVKAALGLQMTHIPFKGTGESVPALLGGHVEVAFSAYPSLSGAAKNNSVRFLANNGIGRSPLAPEVPPLADVIPGFNFAPIVGIYARAGTPRPIIDKIAEEAVAIAKEEEVGRQFAALGIEPVTGGADEFARAIQEESDRVAAVAKSANIKLD